MKSSYQWNIRFNFYFKTDVYYNKIDSKKCVPNNAGKYFALSQYQNALEKAQRACTDDSNCYAITYSPDSLPGFQLCEGFHSNEKELSDVQSYLYRKELGKNMKTYDCHCLVK